MPSSLSVPVDERFTTALIAEVNTGLQSTAGDLTKWNKVISILLKHKVAWRRIVKIAELMVHPKNRGGLGLNPHNVHRTLAIVKAVGADKEHVKKATAFEVAPSIDVQNDAPALNKSLIERAGGLLAPLTGDERLLTVACSHFSAGLCAAKHGCKTPAKSLQDQNGNINLLQLCDGDAELLSLVENGFEFSIVPWYAEVIWPQLADLAQNALNA